MARRRAIPRAGLVNPIQARLAFQPNGGAFVAELVVMDRGAALIRRIRDASVETLTPVLPSLLTAVLAREDVTRSNGNPLLLVNPEYGLLGVATGPPESPRQLRVQANVCRIEDGHAVEIPAAADDQPSLQLVALVTPAAEKVEEQP